MCAVVCGVVAAAQLIGNAPARGAEPPAAERVTLSGRTRIVGSGSGAIDVRLPKAVTLTRRHALHAPAGPNDDVTFVRRGRASFVGFALVEDPYPEVRRDGRFLIGGQFALCDRPPCRAVDTYNDYWWAGYDRGQRVIEPGDYQLLLIGEGPVEIELRLPGLGGRTTVRPAPQEFATVERLTPRSVAVGSGETWWGGSESYGGQVGFSASMAVAKAPLFAGGEFGICQYNGGDPPPDDLAYGRHCQTAAEALGAGVHYKFGATHEDEELVFSTSFGYHANRRTIGVPNLQGDHGLGVWASVESRLSYFELATVFVALDEIQ